MSKKLLMFTLISLALLMMVAPVMAKPIGPRKSNNPRVEINEVTGEVGQFLPNGGMHSWMDTELMAIDFMHCLDASKAHGLVHEAITIVAGDLEGWMTLIMTDPEGALEALGNTWFYMPYDTLRLMLELEGEDPDMADMWPDGIYCRFANMGPTWDA